MLTAAATIRDRVEGLNLGADDYLPKPFAFEELVARVLALGRRAPSGPPVLVRADLELDRARRQATRGGRALSLTRKELGGASRCSSKPMAAWSARRTCWSGCSCHHAFS